MFADTDNRTKIKVPAELTPGTISNLLAAVDDLLQTNPNEVVLDCSRLERITSTHINILWNVRSRCAERRVDLRLDNLHPNFLKVLEVLDLADLFYLHNVQQHTCSVTRSTVSPEEYGQELLLRVELSPMAVASAMKKLRQHLVRRGVGDREIVELETIFYEVATNIRLHSGLAERDAVDVSVKLNGDEAEFRFIDKGKAFDPTPHKDDFDPSQVINRRQNHGIGVILIKRMTDRMHYERKQGQLNVLTLTKKLERADE